MLQQLAVLMSNTVTTATTVTSTATITTSTAIRYVACFELA